VPGQAGDNRKTVETLAGRHFSPQAIDHEEFESPAENDQMIRQWLKRDVPAINSLDPLQFVVGGLLSRRVRFDCRCNFDVVDNQKNVRRQAIRTARSTHYTVWGAAQTRAISLLPVRLRLDARASLSVEVGRLLESAARLEE
jgi:hypothetical protein